MIYPHLVTGGTIGSKSWNDVLQEQQLEYNRMQRKAAFEKVASGACLSNQIDATGLMAQQSIVSKSLSAPSNTVRNFSYKMADMAMRQCGMPPPVQVQRAHQGDKDKRSVRKQDEAEQPDVAQEIETLKQMVSAIGLGLASALKQSAAQGRKEQPREEPEEKAGFFDPDYYVVTGFSHVAGQGKRDVMGKVRNNPQVAKSGVEIFRRVGPNSFEPITKMLPISPITGQPSSLRQISLSKAGLTQKSGHMPTRLQDCSSIIPGEICEEIETETRRRQPQGNLKSDALRRSGLIG